jgi:hypothetical protein
VCVCVWSGRCGQAGEDKRVRTSACVLCGAVECMYLSRKDHMNTCIATIESCWFERHRAYPFSQKKKEKKKEKGRKKEEKKKKKEEKKWVVHSRHGSELCVFCVGTNLNDNAHGCNEVDDTHGDHRSHEHPLQVCLGVHPAQRGCVGRTRRRCDETVGVEKHRECWRKQRSSPRKELEASEVDGCTSLLILKHHHKRLVQVISVMEGGAKWVWSLVSRYGQPRMKSLN